METSSFRSVAPQILKHPMVHDWGEAHNHAAPVIPREPHNGIAGNPPAALPSRGVGMAQNLF